jgi:enoyl-CoA hydratase
MSPGAVAEPRPKVRVEADGPVAIVTIDRPEVRNAIDPETASLLAGAFRAFDADGELNVAVLTGADGTFCSGADLKALARGDAHRLAEDGDGPLGPTRMVLSKPVIAAMEGYAVAGGLELALWCDLRVAARDAVFGFFDRRFGVPLVDLGTIRLPRLIGHSRAIDMILTGRPVSGEEAYGVGLVNRLVDHGAALDAATQLAHDLARFPQACMRSDRLSAYEQWWLPFDEALRGELRHGLEAIASGETGRGAERFVNGTGRHGSFDDRGDIGA